MEAKIDYIKRLSYSLALILVPIILVFGFLSHENLQDMNSPSSNVDAWINEFHGNQHWLIAHMAVMFSAILVAIIFLGFMSSLKKEAPLLSFITGILGVFGSFMLVADKAALTLVPSAFETLPDEQFWQLRPGLEAMINYEGQLWMAQLYFLIPLGFLLMSIVLLKTRRVARWQAISILLGSLLFFNPDIDLISLIASVFLAIGMVPWGLQEFKKSKISTNGIK